MRDGSLPKYREHSGYYAGAEFFGLDISDSFYLFDPDKYIGRHKASQNDIIKHIDVLIDECKKK